MTRERMADGLMILVLQLGNQHAGDVMVPPPTWEPHEWAYLKGLATAELLRLRERLLTTGKS